MRYLKITVIFVAIFSKSTAQNGIIQIGARSAGMANISSTIADSWSLFNNPGGLGRLSETSVLFAYENRYLPEDLYRTTTGFITILPLGNIGVSLFRFGDDLYNEQAASLSFGNKFGLTSLGMRVNYLQYHIEGLGNKSVITLDFGGISQLTKTLTFGAYIRNINQAAISKITDERVPTVLNAGICYNPTSKVMLNIATEKDIDYKATLKLGLEYKFLKKFVARTGINTLPFTNHFGFGFVSGKLLIDYALTRDLILGLGHQASLVYRLKRKI